MFTLIFAKLIHVMLVEGKSLQVKALDQWTRDLPNDAPRGQILDRNGVVLAGTATRYNLYVRPNSATDKEGLAQCLAEVFGYDKDKVLEKISKKVSEVTVATKVTKEQMSALFDMGFDGLYYSEDNFRYYPYGDFMTQVLGFTGADGNGQTGLEAYYDKYLTGINGYILTETDLVGREIEGGENYYLPSISGLNLTTTLDSRVQEIVEGAVEKAVALYNPKAVACLVMDYTNGEIISLAEYPSFDLNNVPRDDLEKLFSSSKSMLVSSVYEPGSTFKILTAAAALDTGAMNTAKRFYCPGFRMVDGKRIRCWKTKGHGSIDFGEGVESSCNCVFMDSALAMGTDKFYTYLKNFGLRAKTGVDMTGETSGIFISQDLVKTVDLARIGFGQAVAVTPIGMMTACSAVVNGGKTVTPHLVKGFADEKGNKIDDVFVIEEKNTVVSGDTSATMRELLSRVVSHGSGKGAGVNGYNIAGKTGTAQKYENGGIAQGKYISSFLGFSLEAGAPYGVLMIVDEPKGYVYYGSLVAAPLVGDIFRSVFDLFSLPKSNDFDVESSFNPDNIEDYIDLVE
ncbi:MAG: stage V sporulation protein D [Clostridia bacterium]|nr:stage V sporulation protein D [Clostridia bacterium]